MQNKGIWGLGGLLAILASCSDSDTTRFRGEQAPLGDAREALRAMTEDEARQDLDQLFATVRGYYGPAEYKEELFGYSLADLEAEAHTRLLPGSGDDGFYAAANWFLAQLQDAHVSLSRNRSDAEVVGHQIGIVLQPFEGRALIAALSDPSLGVLGVAVGDEVLTVDGVTPHSLLPEILQVSSFSNPASNEHFIFRTFQRPSFARSLAPSGPTAHVLLQRPDGSEYEVDLVWEAVEEPRPQVARGRDLLGLLAEDSMLVERALELNVGGENSLLTIGAAQPFFVNAATSAVFNIVEVQPNEAYSRRYGLDPDALPNIYSALYAYGDHVLLLVRQPTYGAADNVARLQYFKAVMDQFDGFVDGLVVDQTHNPGGALSYCSAFAGLFAQEVGEGIVQAHNADRRWINVYRDVVGDLGVPLDHEVARKFELDANLIEAAYDERLALAPPVSFDLDSKLHPDSEYVWTKPMVALIDELAGSCGDIFPLLVKNNQLGTLFGKRTMGAGGNVEAFGPLLNSDATFSLTRGLFTTHREDGQYSPDVFVENHGVSPDVEHDITVEEFRSGYLGYMAHFSEVIAQVIEPSEPTEDLEPEAEGEVGAEQAQPPVPDDTEPSEPPVVPDEPEEAPEPQPVEPQ